MCGIAGFSSFKTNFLANLDTKETQTQQLINMRKVMAHRGHDQTGEFLQNHVGFSHTRLSIRDVSSGKQPMTKTLSHGEFTIVYNGEIYHTEDLVDTLKQKGYEFKTTCDTEAILYAYIEYGTDCVNHINGIFAFAIWDSYKKELMLARDHVGVKPLFFTQKEDTIIFGSEIKSLFAHSLVKPEVDVTSFQEIFGVGPARTPSCGVFKDISELKAGHFAIYNQYGLKIEQYWDMTIKEHNDNYSQTVEHVKHLVTHSIKGQMVADVPVCSFLSGGIDSSIITAIASAHCSENGGKLNTYSFDFAGNDKYFTSNPFQPERDITYVKKMLENIDVNHKFLECDESQLVKLLKNSMLSKDLPGMADVDASLLYFCSVVKQENKVALTGECADEIFGGYPWFYREDLLNSTTFPWSKDMETRNSLLQDSVAKKLNIAQYSQNQYDKTIASVPRKYEENNTDDKAREIMYLNIKWFMQTLLDRMDRASMNNSLESRVPFADYRIIDYLYNVPWSMKRRNNVEKSLLRDAFADVLPDELLNRKKSPYPKTYHPNYIRLLKEELSKILADSNAPIHSVIDKNKVTEFMTQAVEHGKPWFGQLMAGSQMMAYIIQLNYWLDEYKPRIIL